MNIDTWNKDIEYVSVKDMSLEQLVSFSIAQYKYLHLGLNSWNRGYRYKDVTLDDFVNSLCINASGSDIGKCWRYPGASLDKARELVSKQFPDFYPFKGGEFISDVPRYIDEQRSFRREHRVPHYLPLNPIDFSSYDLGNIPVVEGTELLECSYYAYLGRYVYTVSIPCTICGKERIHTLRMTLEEYKKVVKYHACILKEAQEQIEREEKWKHNADRINNALKQRFRIPGSLDFYELKTLKNTGVDITFIHKASNEVICKSSGKIKGVRPFTREDFTYRTSNGSCVEAYHLAVYLEGVMFQGKGVKALGDIKPIDLVMEDLDITSPWFMYLEEPFTCKSTSYSLELKMPYEGVLCLMEIKED